MVAERLKYGLSWDWQSFPDDLSIELYFIKNGGSVTVGGKTFGRGLFEHYKGAMQILWPEDDWHRWHDLAIRTYADNIITVLMGPADAGKTYPTSKWILVEYWADPENTLCLVSSTDVRGLQLRVWGQIKGLFNRARARFPRLPGVPLESLYCIATDEIDDDQDRARVLNRGIICIPCLQGGQYTGLGKYHGVKAPRLRQASDECQFMGRSHLDAIANYLGKDYKAGFLGNPIDQLDPLGIVAEPEAGWETQAEPEKTTTWKTKLAGGTCVNFVGTDSPNFDYPGQDAHYPYLIGRKKIEATEAFWGKDSLQYYSQCVGVMKSGLMLNRVINREMCKAHHALEKAVWSGVGKRQKIYAIDAAYSGVGGDRCVAGSAEFGEDINGIQILKVNLPSVVPVSLRRAEQPEDQIAAYVKEDTTNQGIPPEDIFYDSTGRGTLGAAFARLFGHRTPVPVEFGGRPSRRPVRHDLFVQEPDGTQRHKRCDEHYYDFVSELWFSVRYVVESDQMRELPEDVMREGCQRQHGMTAGNKAFVESKHDPKARERMVRSPDLFDWLVTIVEGARQRGFKIQKLGAVLVEEDRSWLEQEAEEYDREIQNLLLTHA